LDTTPSHLDTTPSDSDSSRPSTFPSIDLYASEGSFAGPPFGDHEFSLVFGDLSRSAPGFYPFVGSPSSDSAGDPLGDLTFPAFFPDFGAGTLDGLTHATTQAQPQRQLSADDTSMSVSMAASLSLNKRARLTLEADGASQDRATLPRRPSANRPLQPAAPHPASFAEASQTVKPKLRSASSSSKNFGHRSSDTPKERKERDSHNMVEKKYRNRLNAKYEGLMNSLPPEMQLPTHATAAGGSGASADHADKPLSKGEVLDKSTAYIHELERNHARLSEENEAISKNIERLCSTFSGGQNVGDIRRPEG
jgi:hypothetical protein